VQQQSKKPSGGETQRRAAAPAGTPAVRKTPRPAPPARRVCPCGGGCPRCAAPSTKPAEERSTDELEREADRFAAAFATAAPAGPPLRSTGGLRLRAPALALGPGEPLAPAVRAPFERFTGVALAAVRVHRDASTAAVTARLDARAFASGTHIGFAPGELEPATAAGRRLIAHELAHVFQQQHGRPGVHLQRHRRRRRRGRAGEFAPDAVALLRSLERVDPALRRFAEDSLRFLQRADSRLGPAVMLDSMTALRRAVSRLETAQHRVLRAPTAAHIRSWLTLSRETLGAVQLVLDHADGTAHHPRADIGRPVGRPIGPLDVSGLMHRQIATLSDRAVHLHGQLYRHLSGYRREDGTRADETHRRERDPEQRTIRRLRAWLAHRGNHRILEHHPSMASAALAQIIGSGIGRDPGRLRAFFEQLRELDARLFEEVIAGGWTARALQGESEEDVLASLGRVMLHAAMGEWYEGHGDVAAGEWDQLGEFGVTTREEELDLEDTTSTLIDTGASLAPVVDQIADVRDVSAVIYRLMNLDSAHDDAIEDPWQWAGLVLTLVGTIPEIGSVIHGVGRLAMRGVRRGAEAVSEGPVRRALARYAPDALELLEDVIRQAGRDWPHIVELVNGHWRAIAGRIDGAFDALGGLGRRLQRRAYARWRLVRRTAPSMIPDGLRRLLQALGTILGAAASVGRRSADAVLERARRLRDFARQFSATGRLQLADDAFARVDNLQARLRTALEAGADSPAVRDLIDQLGDATDDLERTLQRTGADVAETAPAAERRAAHAAEAAPPPHPPRVHSPTQRRLIEESGGMEDVAGAHRDAELLAVRDSRARPSSLEGYDREVDLGNGHVWRRQEGGHAWCRFSEDPSQCVPAAAVDALDDAEFQRLHPNLSAALEEDAARRQYPLTSQLLDDEEAFRASLRGENPLGETLDSALVGAERRFLGEVASSRAPRLVEERFERALSDLRSGGNVQLFRTTAEEQIALLRRLEAEGGLAPAVRRGGRTSTMVSGGLEDTTVFLNTGADGSLSLSHVYVLGPRRYERGARTIPEHIRRMEERFRANPGEAIRQLSPGHRVLVLVVEPARRPGTHAAMRVGEELARAHPGTTLEEALSGQLAPLAFEGASTNDREVLRRLANLLTRVAGDTETAALPGRGGRRLRTLGAAIRRHQRTIDAVRRGRVDAHAARATARAVEDRILDLLRFFRGEGRPRPLPSPRSVPPVR